MRDVLVTRPPILLEEVEEGVRVEHRVGFLFEGKGLGRSVSQTPPEKSYSVSKLAVKSPVLVVPCQHLQVEHGEKDVEELLRASDP